MKNYTNLSKTKIKFRSKNKTNPTVVETLDLAKKSKNWLAVAKILAGARRAYQKVNLFEIDLQAKDGDTVIIIGKVLSLGELSKKVKIRAMAYSMTAEEKLKKAKADYGYVLDEIKNNEKAERIKILK